jgi:hypothetical protein
VPGNDSDAGYVSCCDVPDGVWIGWTPQGGMLKEAATVSSTMQTDAPYQPVRSRRLDWEPASSAPQGRTPAWRGD